MPGRGHDLCKLGPALLACPAGGVDANCAILFSTLHDHGCIEHEQRVAVPPARHANNAAVYLTSEVVKRAAALPSVVMRPMFTKHRDLAREINRGIVGVTCGRD